MSSETLPHTGNGRRKTAWWTALFGGSLWLAILVHVLFVSIATVIVVEHFQKKQINFQSTPPPAPSVNVEHKVEMAKRNSVASAPPDLKRIVTTDISTVTLPDVPVTPTVDETTPTLMAGEGDIGEGMGTGNGNGNGNGGGSPDFGSPTGGGLEGFFYDLKQTPDHQPTGMNEMQMISTVGHFCRQGWNEEEFATHFLRSPKPLYTNQIIIPRVISAEGPKAFGMDNICRPGYWLAIYHFKFSPTVNGYFHLAGYGDDFLIVRINGDTVLDSGWYAPVTSARAVTTYSPTWAPSGIKGLRNHDGSPYYRTVVGNRFSLDAGDSVTIDVLIGDCDLYGGLGACGFSLYLLQDGKDYPKDPTGFPIFPLLQIGPDTTVKRNGDYPPFSCNSADAMTQP